MPRSRESIRLHLTLLACGKRRSCGAVDTELKTVRKQIEERIVINCKFRDWNGIYTNCATWLARLFFAAVRW